MADAHAEISDDVFLHDCLEPTVFLLPLDLWQKPASNQNSFLAFMSIR